MIKTAEEIEKIRKSCKMVSATLREIKKLVRPGATPLDLDDFAYQFIVKNGGKPAFLGYRNYPNSICVSVNHEVVHGIPNKRKFKNGDLVSVDCGVELDGYFGDSAYTFVVGRIPSHVQLLVDKTQEALMAGISKAVAGNRLGDIGAAIEGVARKAGFSVIREFCGHGVGKALHEEPDVPNYGYPGTGMPLLAGMVIAIEPMVNLGKEEVKLAKDEWTIMTKDRQLSAHFEHTVAIEEKEASILTSFDF